jgi:hypothetical protein
LFGKKKLQVVKTVAGYRFQVAGKTYNSHFLETCNLKLVTGSNKKPAQKTEAGLCVAHETERTCVYDREWSIVNGAREL